MKLRSLACAMALASALSVSIASAAREEPVQTGVTSVAAFVQMWQDRINNERLPVADPSTWALRNMQRFAGFSAERLALAKRATSIQELEALLVTAPVPNGTSLAMLLATQPGNISLEGLATGGAMVAVPKNDPTTTPTAYSDLVFTAVNPCRVYDSRVSSGGAGPWINGVSRTIDFGPKFTYSFQGGSATNCGLNTLVGLGKIAAVMFAASSFSQTGTGYLTFWASTAADPSATVVSMFYAPGAVQTAFVVSPTDLILNVFVRGISKLADTEVTADIVGYFAKPAAVALDCTTVSSAQTPVAAGANAQVSAPACAAGYTLVTVACASDSYLTWVAALNDGQGCAYQNSDGSAHNISASSKCCRTAGR